MSILSGKHWAESSGSTLNRTTRSAVIAACLAASPLYMHSAQATPIDWSDGTLKYVVFEQNLRDVFQNLASHLHVPISLNKRVSRYKIAERAPPMNAKDFLDWLCIQHNLIWYYDGTILNVELRSEFRPRALPSYGVPDEAIAERLNILDAADSRFTVQTSKDKSSLIVDGPPSFAMQVSRVVADLVMEQAEAQPPEIEDRGDMREWRNLDLPEGGEQRRNEASQEPLPQTADGLYPAVRSEGNSKVSIPRKVKTPTGVYWVREERINSIESAQGEIRIRQEKLGRKPLGAADSVTDKNLQPRKKVRVYRGT